MPRFGLFCAVIHVKPQSSTPRPGAAPTPHTPVSGNTGTTTGAQDPSAHLNHGVDITSLSAPPTVEPRLCVDITSGEQLSMETIVAALLCQRGRLLAIAYGTPHWFSRAAKVPRGEPPVETATPVTAPEGLIGTGGKVSLFEAAAALTPRRSVTGDGAAQPGVYCLS